MFAAAYAELRHYEDAQDVVVSALCQICQHIGDLHQPERVNAWMFRIVRNEARQWRRSSLPAAMAADVEATGSERAGLDACLLRMDVAEALKRLPQDQARVITLFYWQHLSTHEIAGQLERPEGTVRRWLHLARRQLATEMKEYDSMKSTATAAIVHTELTTTVLQHLRKALRAGGYTTQIVPPSEVTSVSYGPGVSRPLGNYAFAAHSLLRSHGRDRASYRDTDAIRALCLSSGHSHRSRGGR